MDIFNFRAELCSRKGFRAHPLGSMKGFRAALGSRKSLRAEHAEFKMGRFASQKIEKKLKFSFKFKKKKFKKSCMFFEISEIFLSGWKFK